MAYFTIMTGLRGCYMSDQSYTVQVKTRRDLKSVIENEADMQANGETPVVGLSKRAIAAFAAQCWRDRNDSRWNMNYALGWNYRGQISQRCYGIFVSRATRQDYLESQESE